MNINWLVLFMSNIYNLRICRRYEFELLKFQNKSMEYEKIKPTMLCIDSMPMQLARFLN